MEERYFSEKVVEWYLANKRNLPWRHTTDPYKIWLSEVILQQTRVNQGLPYYVRFLDEYPDVFSLAKAPEQEVLRVWQGLGYYSRARNLHRCARIVAEIHNGVFPIRYAELVKLPGIGSYTAAAIASICSLEQVAVVDGNVFRVISRVFGIASDILSTDGKKTFTKKAQSLVQPGRPDLHNQAVMEFGALWCTPRDPKCEGCPFQTSCFAAKNSLQRVLPVKTKSKKPVKRFFYYFVLKRGNSLLMKKREAGDIWQGLYDFFLIEKSKTMKPSRIIEENAFLKKLSANNDQIEISAEYRHLLSHQTIVSKFIVMEASKSTALVEEEPMKYYPIKKIHDLPKPVLISRFLSDYNFL